MTTKIIVITGLSIAAVVGMFLMGRCMDKDDADAKEKENPLSRHDET